MFLFGSKARSRAGRRSNLRSSVILASAARSFVESLEARQMLTAVPTLLFNSAAHTVDSITLQYKTTDGARLELEQDAPGDGKYAKVDVSLDSSPLASGYHSVTVPNLKSGKAYTYRLRADSDGVVAYSGETPATTVAAPEFPVTLSAPVIDVEHIEFQWDNYYSAQESVWVVPFSAQDDDADANTGNVELELRATIDGDTYRV